MKFILPGAVFVLMMSVGMSLRHDKMLAAYRRMTWSAWLRLLLATFIVPPAIALLLPHIFPLTLPEMAGLFMVGVAPGAPLMTRNIAKKGFDMHLAAGYQLWGALLIPVMIPLVVFAAGKTLRPRYLDPAARAADGDRGKTVSAAAAGNGASHTCCR